MNACHAQSYPAKRRLNKLLANALFERHAIKTEKATTNDALSLTSLVIALRDRANPEDLSLVSGLDTSYGLFKPKPLRLD